MRKQDYEIILRNLPIGFSVVDQDGVILDFNSAAEAITGYARSEVLGESHFQVLHGTPDKKACPLLHHALHKREEVVAAESTILHKNGDQIILSVTAFPLIDDQGSFQGGVEIFRDITESRRQARERKNILSMFAHDMKNPLASSGGLLSRLLSGKVGELEEKQRAYLEIVHDNFSKVENLLTEFLEFSRLETKEYTPQKVQFNLVDTMTKFIEGIQIEAEKKNIQLTFEFPKDLPETIYADSMMMDRVITNLLSNALKYSELNGTVKVELARVDKHILTRITNSGAGIAEDHFPFLFDAFFQVSQGSQGAGLGLAITKSIIEAHGGRIWVKSVPGTETTFSFTLPEKEKEREQSQISASHSS